MRKVRRIHSEKSAGGDVSFELASTSAESEACYEKKSHQKRLRYSNTGQYSTKNRVSYYKVNIHHYDDRSKPETFENGKYDKSHSTKTIVDAIRCCWYIDRISLSLIFALLWLLHLLCALVNAQTHRNVELGFPDAWDGDKHPALYCPANNIPEFLDGYFLCQLSAAYGERNAPAGRRLTHMIDAIGAVGSFHIHRGEVTFMARYYPSRPYKIWEFYDRNMSLASVPWVGWSAYNVTAVNAWERVAGAANAARFHPNIDFWRVGKRILAGTEAAYWVGYEFDVRTLDNFTLFRFVERNEVFGRPTPSLIPISMSIHERVDARDGTLWGSFSAMNFAERRFYQGIFTVDAEGFRRVVGMFEYGTWDPNACANNDEYIGDKGQLAGYVHSITSTENYVVLPITSLLINPCKFKEPPFSDPNSSIQNGGLWGMDFYEMMPVRFLVFDKRKRTWRTQKPLEVFPSMFITHQLNAYEEADNSYIIADMIVYDNHDPYVKFFYTDFLTSQTYPSAARLLRFTLDVRDMKIMYSYLVPQETISADFPQINHAYDGRRYEWAYAVSHPFAAENSLLKLNVDNPGGQRNQRFQPTGPDSQLVLHEPWFVARPDPISEDDGVLLVRALDLSENKGILLIVDAITMLEIGRAVVPISVPFGFHNRFFSSADLGLPSEPAAFPDLAASHRFGSLKGTQVGNSVVIDSSSGRLFRPNTWRKHGTNSGDELPDYWPRLQTTTPVPPPSWIYVEPRTTTIAPPPPTPTFITEWVLRTKASTPPLPVPTAPRETEEGRSPSILPMRRRKPDQIVSKPDSRDESSLERHHVLPVTVFATRQSPTVEDLAAHRLAIKRPDEPVGSSPSITIISSQSGGYNHAIGMVPRSDLREIYEKSLRALCRWLPKILENITIEGCVQANHYSQRWMRPERPTGGEQSQVVEMSSETPPTDFRYANLRTAPNVIRPVLKPVYPPRAAHWYSNYRQPYRATYPFH